MKTMFFKKDLNYSDLLEVKLEICYYIIECLTQIRNCTWAILKKFMHGLFLFFFLLLFLCKDLISNLGGEGGLSGALMRVVQFMIYCGDDLRNTRELSSISRLRALWHPETFNNITCLYIHCSVYQVQSWTSIFFLARIVRLFLDYLKICLKDL